MKRGSWVLILGLPFIFSSSADAASTTATSAVVYDEGFFSGPVTINGTPAINGGSSAIGYNSSVVPGMATSGYGEAQFGALHASAFSGAINAASPQTTQVRGQGSASWIDQLTISSPVLTGSAFAHAKFSLSGSLDSLSDPLGVGALGNSTVSASVLINGGTTVFSTSGQIVSRNGSIITNELKRGQAQNGIIDIHPVSSLAGTFEFDIPFVFGTSFQMFASLTAFTQALAAVAGDDASAASSFGSSGLWGGISGVHLADGTELTGYSIGSDSGFDYRNAFTSEPAVVPVPVPATVWLAGSGLLALIALRRRAKAA